MPAAPLSFAVHWAARQARGGQQLCAGLAGGWVARAPAGQARDHAVRAQPVRFAQARQQAALHGLRHVVPAVDQDHGEFGTAGPQHGVGPAHAAAQALAGFKRQPLQQLGCRPAVGVPTAADGHGQHHQNRLVCKFHRLHSLFRD